MITQKTEKSFIKGLDKKIKGLHPTSGQLELTYRCNLDCVHCYCKGVNGIKELNSRQWKDILNQLYSAGTIYLTLTGGEPLLRNDFFDIYDYARKKGFLITVFTSSTLLDDKAITYLAQYPPYCVEITLHGITEKVYESISRVKGSFEKAMLNIGKLAARNVPLVLKAVGLKENRCEIPKIKSFAENLLGKKRFRFDSFITPTLTGGSAPCRHRLSAEEIETLEGSDEDMRSQLEEGFEKNKPRMRPPQYKYHCDAWFRRFFVTPDGFLRFCHLTDRYSTDLRKASFLKGFYGRFPAILEEKRTASSRCAACNLREFCRICPARAYLETGGEENPVMYLCELAAMTKRRYDKGKGV